MVKRIFFVAIAVSLLAACNNQQSEEAIALTTTEFAEKAADMVDQTITLEGTVMHVCKHGGKKMFINDENVKIVVSEKIAAFDQELVGSDIVITGIIKEELVEPVLEESADMKHTTGDEKPQVVDGDTIPAAECEMEAIKPLYVVEVIKVAEKK